MVVAPSVFQGGFVKRKRVCLETVSGGCDESAGAVYLLDSSGANWHICVEYNYDPTVG